MAYTATNTFFTINMQRFHTIYILHHHLIDSSYCFTVRSIIMWGEPQPKSLLNELPLLVTMTSFFIFTMETDNNRTKTDLQMSAVCAHKCAQKSMHIHTNTHTQYLVCHLFYHFSKLNSIIVSLIIKARISIQINVANL